MVKMCEDLSYLALGDDFIEGVFYGRFTLLGQDVCDPQKLSNLSHVENDKTDTLFYIWHLLSYTCRDISKVSFSFYDTD